MGTAGLGSAGYASRVRVDSYGRGIPVTDFTLAPDLLKPVTARDQILENGARNPILDLHPAHARLRRIPADQKARRFDRLLHRHAGVDDVEGDSVHGRRGPG